MARVFPEGVPASGTKPLTGHTLGAAGATEAGFAWLALTRDDLPCQSIDGTAKPIRHCRRSTWWKIRAASAQNSTQ